MNSDKQLKKNNEKRQNKTSTIAWGYPFTIYNLLCVIVILNFFPLSAAKVQARLLTVGANVRIDRVALMRVWQVVHESDLALVEHVHNIIGVHGRIAPALVVEAARAIQVVEVAQILLAAVHGERGDLEVVVENARRARVERGALSARDKGERVVYSRPPLALVHPGAYGAPQRRNGEHALVAGHGEAVRDVLGVEQPKRIVAERARKLRVAVDAQVVVVLERERVSEEEATHEATHVTVGELEADVAQAAVELGLVDPLRRRPVLGLDDAELDGGVRVCTHRALELVA